VALLRLGSAKSSLVAKEAGVPRSGIYQLIESLQEKGVVTRQPGGGPAVWTTPGRDKVLDRLHTAMVAAQQERIEQLGLRTTLLRELLAESLPQPGEPDLPYVHILTCPARLRDEHQRLFAHARHHVMAFNRPPYSTDAGGAFAVTVQALERGVAMRALYQSAQADDPEAVGFRASADAYRAAGVEARVVDELPVKLLVVDGEAAIVALENPSVADGGFPVTLLIEHPGFAALLTALFEQQWAAGRPYGEDPPPPS
jgi:HTH-type transcriptional regulator, sugar sensing transcriptional regulator